MAESTTWDCVGQWADIIFGEYKRTCCTLCSFGDERILSSLSLRDIGASTVILLYFRVESLYQLAVWTRLVRLFF